MDLPLRERYRLLCRSSKRSLQNKILLYKDVIKLIWTFGVELCGCQQIQHTHNAMITAMVDTSGYVSSLINLNRV